MPSDATDGLAALFLAVGPPAAPPANNERTAEARTDSTATQWMNEASGCTPCLPAARAARLHEFVGIGLADDDAEPLEAAQKLGPRELAIMTGVERAEDVVPALPTASEAIAH